MSLSPTHRPDHAVALLIGQSIADDVETYDVQALSGGAEELVWLPADRTQLFLEVDGRSFECIVFEKTGGE